jgi:hypothetical protein
MNLDDAPTYQLLQYGVRICKHCALFRTEQCTAVQGAPLEFVNWSSLSTCPAWAPNERADYALQVLTYRKLSGYDEKAERGDQ